MPSMRCYPHPSMGWGESLFSPTRSTGMLPDFGQGLLDAIREMVSLPICGMGGFVRDKSTFPFKMLVYRVLVFKNSIQNGSDFHWIKWCRLGLHILKWEWSSRRVNLFLKIIAQRCKTFPHDIATHPWGFLLRAPSHQPDSRPRGEQGGEGI